MSWGRNRSHALKGEPRGLLPLTHLCPGDPQKLGARWSPQLQSHFFSSSSLSSSSHDLHQAGEPVKLYTSFLPPMRGQSCPATLLTAHLPGIRPAVASLFAPRVPLSCLLLPSLPCGFPTQERTRPFPEDRDLWSRAGWGMQVGGRLVC